MSISPERPGPHVPFLPRKEGGEISKSSEFSPEKRTGIYSLFQKALSNPSALTDLGEIRHLDDIFRSFDTDPSTDQKLYQTFFKTLVNERSSSQATEFVERMLKRIEEDLQKHFDKLARLTPNDLVNRARFLKDLSPINPNQYAKHHAVAMLLYEKASDLHIRKHDLGKAHSLRLEVLQEWPLPQEHPLNHLLQSLEQSKSQKEFSDIHFASGGNLLQDRVLHSFLKPTKIGSELKHTIQVDGRLLPFARLQLERWIQKMLAHPIPGIQIEQTHFKYDRRVGQIFDPLDKPMYMGTQWEIKIDNAGRFYIGADVTWGTLYDHFSIEIDQSEIKNDQQLGEKIYQIFILTGLGPATYLPRDEDVERGKLMFYLWTQFPKIYAAFDQRLLVYASPRRLIDLLNKETEEQFEKLYYAMASQIERRSLLPGYEVEYAPIYKEKVKAAGGRFLTHGMFFGIDVTWAERASFFANLMKSGLNCSQDRGRMGILGHGKSPNEDHRYGGASNIFTRLISQNALDNEQVVDEMYPGSMLILISLDVFKRKTLQYSSDHFGVTNGYNKDPDFLEEYIAYLKRPTAEEFAREMNAYWSDNNEVMIQKKVLPDEIYGVLLSNEATRFEFIQELKKYMVDIHGIPLEKCIVSGTSLQPEYSQEFMASAP
jgi:hypothetical protein